MYTSPALKHSDIFKHPIVKRTDPVHAFSKALVMGHNHKSSVVFLVQFQHQRIDRFRHFAVEVTSRLISQDAQGFSNHGTGQCSALALAAG